MLVPKPDAADTSLGRKSRTSDRLGLAGRVAATYLILLVALIALSPLLPWDSSQQDLSLRLASPSRAISHGARFILGADHLGRPVAARLIDGAWVSVTVGLAASAIAMIIGVGVGIFAGVRRGWVEDAIMRIIDVWMALPTLLIALVALFILGSGVLNVILVLALMRWVVFARVSRALTLSIRERQFFEAAVSIGCSTPRIVAKHVLPNMRWEILVVATLEIARAMLSEAALSFLGLGIQPPQTSWGQMLASARQYMGEAPWLIFFPGAAILATTLGINVLVHAIRRRARVGVRSSIWTRDT